MSGGKKQHRPTAAAAASGASQAGQPSQKQNEKQSQGLWVAAFVAAAFAIVFALPQLIHGWRGMLCSATSKGPAQVDPWMYTTHPGMATEGWNWTQLSMSRAGNFPPGGVKRFDEQVVREKGEMWVWHTTFARSIPAVVQGLASEYSQRAPSDLPLPQPAAFVSASCHYLGGTK